MLEPNANVLLLDAYEVTELGFKMLGFGPRPGVDPLSSDWYMAPY